MLAILLQSLGSLVVITAFEMNQDYIAKNLCVNKNKPMMHCNGKCHMHKMLQKEASQSQSPSSPVKEKSEVVQFFQPANQFQLVFTFDKSINSFYYSENKISGFTSSVFHPPSC